MYNRYIPGNTSYERIPPPNEPPRRPGNGRPSGPSFPKGGGTAEGLSKWLGGLLHGIHREALDSGDILLVLILLFLFLEGDDDLEPIITLGLLLVFGLFGSDRTEGET